MIAARTEALRALKKLEEYANTSEFELLGKLRAYCGDLAHTCVEKSARLAFVTLHKVKSDEYNFLKGAAVRDVSFRYSFSAA